MIAPGISLQKASRLLKASGLEISALAKVKTAEGEDCQAWLLDGAFLLLFHQAGKDTVTRLGYLVEPISDMDRLYLFGIDRFGPREGLVTMTIPTPQPSSLASPSDPVLKKGIELHAAKRTMKMLGYHPTPLAMMTFDENTGLEMWGLGQDHGTLIATYEVSSGKLRGLSWVLFYFPKDASSKGRVYRRSYEVDVHSFDPARGILTVRALSDR